MANMSFGKYLHMKGEGAGTGVSVGGGGDVAKQLKPSNVFGMHLKHLKQYEKGHSIERETEQHYEISYS